MTRVTTVTSVPEVSYGELDEGIRRYVKIVREAGIDTFGSCQGRDNPGHNVAIHGTHSGDWPYISFSAMPGDAFIALGAALNAGLPVRSIEQCWLVNRPDQGPTATPSGPHWRITFWEMDRVPQ